MAVLSAKPKAAVQNLVLITDFSSAAQLALSYAASVARHYKAKLHLVHAIQAQTSGAAKDAGIELQAAAEIRIHAEAEKCTGVECSEWVLKGTPLAVAERIVSFDKADLVIVGDAGRAGISRGRCRRRCGTFLSTHTLPGAGHRTAAGAVWLDLGTEARPAGDRPANQGDGGRTLRRIPGARARCPAGASTRCTTGICSVSRGPGNYRAALLPVPLARDPGLQASAGISGGVSRPVRRGRGYRDCADRSRTAQRSHRAQRSSPGAPWFSLCP